MFCFDLPMDHVAFSTSDRQAAEVLLHKLGFVFGTSAKDPFIHVIFDNGYLEWVPASYDSKSNLADADGLTAGIRAYYMAVADIQAAHDALIQNGYPVCPAGSFSRYGKHGINRGEVSFGYCIFREQELFPAGVGFGCTRQNNPERIYDGHYRHVNDVGTVKMLVFCTEDAREKAAALEKLSRTLADAGERLHGIPQVAVMDETEYVKTFGQSWAGTDRLTLAAVYFSSCDAEYMKTQLDDLGIAYFLKDRKLYADLRKKLGAFFVFELE